MPKVIKLPTARRPSRSTKNVKSVFKRSMEKAEEQGWRSIIIIGQGKNSGSWQYSDNLLNVTALGMIEQVKYHMNKDSE